jgi:hypothetical protein
MSVDRYVCIGDTQAISVVGQLQTEAQLSWHLLQSPCAGQTDWTQNFLVVIDHLCMLTPCPMLGAQHCFEEQLRRRPMWQSSSAGNNAFLKLFMRTCGVSTRQSQGATVSSTLTHPVLLQLLCTLVLVFCLVPAKCGFRGN